jgi:hypothetical protein
MTRRTVDGEFSVYTQLAALRTHGGLNHDKQNTLWLTCIAFGVCPPELLGQTPMQRIMPRSCNIEAIYAKQQHGPQSVRPQPGSTP